jgi:hypothetical protein
LHPTDTEQHAASVELASDSAMDTFDLSETAETAPAQTTSAMVTLDVL